VSIKLTKEQLQLFSLKELEELQHSVYESGDVEYNDIVTRAVLEKVFRNALGL
jgi:hypothetical protein